MMEVKLDGSRGGRLHCSLAAGHYLQLRSHAPTDMGSRLTRQADTCDNLTAASSH